MNEEEKQLLEKAIKRAKERESISNEEWAESLAKDFALIDDETRTLTKEEQDLFHNALRCSASSIRKPK